MKLQSLKYIIAICSTVFSLTVTENTITDSLYTFPQEPVIIDDNVFWSIWNNYNIYFGGNLNIEGELYISNFNNLGLACGLFQNLPYDFLITGTMGLYSTGYSEYYFPLSSFNNSGEIFFITLGDGNVNARIVSKDWNNTGSITITGPANVTEPEIFSRFAFNDISSGSITNAGDIYLYRSDFEQLTSMTGGGCVHIQDKSSVTFHNPEFDLSDQTFYMVDNQAEIIINNSVHGINVTIAGFGDSNTIVLATLISLLSYNEDGTGKLVILAGGVQHNVNIGLGYDITLFSFTDNVLKYSGAVPDNAMPTNCRIAPSIPVAPSNLPSSS